jgi:hypothetical protein
LIASSENIHGFKIVVVDFSIAGQPLVSKDKRQTDDDQNDRPEVSHVEVEVLLEKKEGTNTQKDKASTSVSTDKKKDTGAHEDYLPCVLIYPPR